MAGADKDLPKIKPWELGLFIPTFILFCWAVVERHEIFEDAVRDYSSGDSFLLLCWTVPVFFILLFSQPWKLRSKYGSFFTMAGLVICSLSFVFIFSGHYSTYRFRVVKFELERWPLGIALGAERPGKSLSGHILNYETGAKFLEDRNLLETIAKDYGARLLAEDNRTPALVWSALKNQGAKFEDLWAKDELKAFFLACWQAQTESVQLRSPDGGWSSIDWAEPYIGPESELLTSEQVETITSYFYEHRQELDDVKLEVLLQSAFRDVGRLDQNQIDALLTVWEERLKNQTPEISVVLAQREKLRALLADRNTLTVAPEVNGWDRGLYLVSYSDVPKLVDPMILSWFGSCGVKVEWAEHDEAELLFEVQLENSGYVPNVRVPVESVAVTVTDTSKESIDFKELPYYWSEYTYDEKPFRIWPFGFDQRLLDREFKYIW